MVRTTLVVVVSGSSLGGCTPAGSVAASAFTRSDTSCRTCNTLACASNTSVTADRPCSDFERIDCSPTMPPSAFSTGCVTSVSTCSLVRPGASVWTMLIGGANSGNTSSFARVSV
jgi:hypothetical protein